MKKVLALVLALVTVLAMMPMVNAAYLDGPKDGYDVTLNSTIKADQDASLETMGAINKTKQTDRNHEVVFEIGAPYTWLNNAQAGLWDDDDEIEFDIVIEGLQKGYVPGHDGAYLKIDGKEYSDNQFRNAYTASTGKLEFSVRIPVKAKGGSFTHTYKVEIGDVMNVTTGTATNMDVRVDEYVEVTVKYDDTSKNEDKLKIIGAKVVHPEQPDIDSDKIGISTVYGYTYNSANAYFADGILYVDGVGTWGTASMSGQTINDNHTDGTLTGNQPLNTSDAVLELTFANKNGAKFENVAYLLENSDVHVYNNDDERGLAGNAIDPSDGNANVLGAKLKDSKARIKFLKNDSKSTKEYTLKVETQGALYTTKVKVKFRNDVKPMDPKGVSFEKSTMTIAVNEVYTPKINTLVSVPSLNYGLRLTDGSAQNIIDVNEKTIIGIAEGTAYVQVVAPYFDGDRVLQYTDTGKVIVTGKVPIDGNANKYYVTARTLNVRKGPGTTYAKVGSLSRGAQVEVISQANGWAKIKYNGADAYISTQYILPVVSSNTQGNYYVTARTLNVRKGAGTSYAVVGKLSRNAKVDVVETVANGSWAKIKYAAGVDGYAYVSMSYLAK